MSIFFKKKTGGFSDVIRCDEPEYLVWKWHPNGVEQGDAKRENAIRTSSVLRVKTGEVAVFVYKQNSGFNEDYIEGPHDETIKTKNFPVLSSIIGLWYEGDTPFQAEVFFINLSQSIQLKFVIPYFDVVDPRFEDFEVPVAVRGTVTFKIEDYRGFVKNHQLATFSMDQLKQKITDAVVRYVKDAVTNAPSANNIPLISIESKIDLITEKAELGIKDRLFDLFGVTVTGLDISSIELDKSSEGYLGLKSVTKDITTRKIQAQTLDYEEKLRIQREEGQYAQRMATRQTNLGAYQTEVSGQVGIAGAEALGKMGANGAGNVNMGHGDAGFNPVQMMAGMAMGTAIGQNMASAFNGAMGSSSNTSVPPKVPTIMYYVVENGKSTGPYDFETMKHMIPTGKLTIDTLVWKQGMANWEKAETLPEFNGMFPPVIPHP